MGSALTGGWASYFPNGSGCDDPWLSPASQHVKFFVASTTTDNPALAALLGRAESLILQKRISSKMNRSRFCGLIFAVVIWGVKWARLPLLLQQALIRPF